MKNPPRLTPSAQTRRTVIAAGASLLVSGCIQNSLIGNAVSVARLAIVGIPDTPISTEYVANVPYASIGAKIGRGPRSFLTLGRYDGPDLHWISEDRAVLVTRNGRLVRVFGVGSDLRDTTGIEDDPIAAGTFAFEGVHQRAVDVAAAFQFGIPVESTFEIVGRETIAILDRSHETLHVREHNVARMARWTFDNEYWLDFQTGYVWRSVQHFAQDTPPVAIEVLKREAQNGPR